MKRFIYLGLIMVTGLSFSTFAQERDSTGMPGDNFDLQAALDLFKQSKDLPDFEKKLNTESNGVNNLDLDGNYTIDYIRVVDKKDGDNHAILLQIPINKTETQDVAAIVIEKRGDSEAQLQIIGDKTLYGEETIMEPIDEKEIKKSTGPALISPTVVVFVNVWYWPCVQYMYAPYYDPWYSPYYWDYYPSWWYPWRPVYYYVYYDRMYYYHGWCQYTTVYNVPNAHRIYMNNLSSSPSVRARYAPQQAAYKGRLVSSQSANRAKGRAESGNGGVVNAPKNTGRVDGTKIETTRPSTNSQPKVRQEAVPRPINPNNQRTIDNGGTNNNGTVRPVEPARRNPNPVPQQRPIERTPQREIQPQSQPQRQTQPTRQMPQNRPVVRPGNGGGRGR